MTQPHNDFVQGIDAGLTYWQNKAKQMDETTINELNVSRKNLILILEFGLQWPQTWQKAAQLLIHIFRFFQLRNHWSEGQSLLRMARKHTSEKETVYMRLLLQTGHLHRLQRNLEQALTIHTDAAVQLRQMKDDGLLARLLVELIFDHLSLNQPVAAKEIGQEAIALAREAGVDTVLHVDALRGLGMALIRSGEAQTAVSYLQNAVAQARQTEQVILISRTLSDLALAWTHLGEVDQADAAYREAENLLNPTIYEWDKTLLLSEMGKLCFSQENWQAAEAAFRQANTFHYNSPGDIAGQTIVLNNLGNVLFKQGKLKEAESYLLASLDLRPQMGGDIGWGNTLGTLAELLICQKRGREAEAIRLYETAIEKLELYPEDVWGQRLLKKFREQLSKLI